VFKLRRVAVLCAQQALIDAQRAYLDRYRTMWSAIVEMQSAAARGGNRRL
jgi:outer membrane protein TolC